MLSHMGTFFFVWGGGGGGCASFGGEKAVKKHIKNIKITKNPSFLTKKGYAANIPNSQNFRKQRFCEELRCENQQRQLNNLNMSVLPGISF